MRYTLSCSFALTFSALTLALVVAHPGDLRAGKDLQLAQAAGTPAPAQSARRALVQQVQLLLIRQGFDPGPADGVIGDRTTRSVQAFQQREGLNVDGRVSTALRTALQRADQRARQPAAAATAPVAKVEAARVAAPLTAVAPRAAPAASIADSTWTLIDSRQAKVSLKLLRDGKIGGVGNPAHWTWQYQNGEILISYDNRMGGWVKRRGTISGTNELRGDATSSRGRKWAWRAIRVDTPR